MSKIDTLFKRLGVTPRDPQLYLTALTHSSYKAEDAKAEDYERLEFLGDSILNFVITSEIFRAYPKKKQGELTNMRKNFVRTHAVSNLGRELNLEKYIRTSKSITYDDLIGNNKYFEDVFEALVGALYLDQGITTTTDFILSMVGDAIKAYDFTQIFDYISTLQEYIQADKQGLPQYQTTPSGFAEKEKAFVSIVSNDGIILGKGFGANNKEAEQMAAKKALEKLAK